ncbi:YtzH-like family protein [Salipaludibacillus daqingensis]|uniref:YtzH-like family protein n=1 Tax=Salipaludibacillus daqingensis TaxID=3041001 RepID=UPI0024763120|nr:YtzH-like family protein [Salipaludibacillus daqingensis]
MSINYHHQLELLNDILENQLDEKYGSHDEFHQLQSTIQSLWQNPEIPEDFKQTLSAIEHYATQHDQEGQRATLPSSELLQWIQEIDQVGNQTIDPNINT